MGHAFIVSVRGMSWQRLPVKVGAALDQLVPACPGARVGVAVSGGPDSVALLSALVALAPGRGLGLVALHVNHALRPEADQEQHLVETLCRRWQVPCIVETLPPRRARGGTEAWARAERYRFFQAARDRHGLAYVALAHTMDDQAETVLFRLLRGSARRGLAGIPPTRDGWLVRPLLGCTRREVLEYLAACRLPFATDASNADLRYSRNKIRHLLLPFLQKEFSLQVNRHLATLAVTLRAEEDWLEVLATGARERVQESPLTLSLVRLAAEPAALRPRILRQWLEQAGQAHDLTFCHLASVQALSEGRTRGRVEVPGDLQVRREGGRLLCEKKSAQSVVAPYSYILTPGQEIRIPQANWRVAMTTPLCWRGSPRQARSADPWTAVFDASALSDTVVVRSFRPGDRVCPLGMKGHKKVHDVFIDAKIPPNLRRGLPLIVTGGEVVWVPGCVRGEAAKVTPATRRVYRIEVNPLPEKQKLC
jgi:tRNA(Ile)-lysidine synthase